MNKADPLGQLVTKVDQLLAKTVQPNRGSQKKPKRQRGQKPSGLSSNPTNRDPSLSLTRSQFTATNPQNLWTFNRASTPGGLRLKGRELIGSCTAPSAITGAFTPLDVGSYGANPPLSPVIFPRLVAIASAFEFYIFHKANLIFNANQPTTTSGEILIAVDYDAEDNTPTSSTQLMSNVSATMANIYSDASLQTLKSLSRLPKFVLVEDNNSDKAQTSQAQFFVCAEGVTADSGAGLGYLSIEYDVELFTPAQVQS
jgi:hypothetical protein